MNVFRSTVFALFAIGIALGRAAADTPVAVGLFSAPVRVERAGSAFDETQGNAAELISGGYDALLLRIHLIRQARESIEIQTFIWSNDECGRLMIYELIEAARRGVQVRIIADHMASDQDPAIVAFLATVHPNFKVRHYRPVMALIKPSVWQTLWTGLRSFRGINQRMHNKLMVVDDAVMITGGRNIENTYFDHANGLNFRDRDVLAVGPVVKAAKVSFDAFWNFKEVVAGEDLADVAALIEQGHFARYAKRADYDFGGYFDDLNREADDLDLIRARFVDRLHPVDSVRLIVDVPGKSVGIFRHDSRITRELRSMASEAKQSILMQTPYLIVSPAARRLVRNLRDKNPDLSIRISSNSFASTDNILAYSANYRMRGLYVDDLKLQIYEYKPHPANQARVFARYDEVAKLRATKNPAAPPPYLCVHAKSVVVDDRVAFVGSYNLDPRSEKLNTEIGLIIEDARFARALRDEIEEDMRPENSWVIGRRKMPLPVAAVNTLVDGVLSLSPLDLWPIQNTSSFELRPNMPAVPTGHPDFYRNYREIGSFPGTESRFTMKEALTRLYKAVGTPITPVL